MALLYNVPSCNGVRRSGLCAVDVGCCRLTDFCVDTEIVVGVLSMLVVVG